jgi:tetratricopeptide (TPR) repeat protein
LGVWEARLAEEGTPRASEPPPDTPDAVDLALRAEQHDPAPDSPARRVLVKHEQLLDQQIGLARNERFRNRIKAVRDGVLAVAVLAMVGAVSWVIWDASRAEGVVIEPLAVAPDLAEAGVTGEVAAGRLLARIATMQEETPSSRESRRTRGGGDEVAVEIPQTGVSAGEIMRLLRRRFGHETVVTGELGRDDAGRLRLRVSADGVPLQLPPSALPKTDRPGVGALLDAGAEAVFLETDAYRYATWLYDAGRPDEGARLTAGLSRRGTRKERAWATSGLSVDARLAGRITEALALAEAAIRLDPELPNAHRNVAFAAGDLGQAERAYAARLKAVGLSRDARSPQAVENRWGDIQEIAWSRGDFERVLAALDGQRAVIRNDEGADRVTSSEAFARAELHEVTEARRLVSGLATPPAPGSFEWKGHIALPLAALGDWAGVEAALRTPAPRGRAGPPRLGDTQAPEAALAAVESTTIRPLLARAVAEQGRAEEAAALIAATPADCYLCLRTRGRIAALRGAHGEADRWFAEAARQAPSLPQAHQDWGEVRLARGDLDGAARAFREARKRGPRWADPRKGEGDVLQRRGDHRAALACYKAALERASRWGAAHLAAGRSLQALGRDAEARDAYRSALTLDLSLADRAEAQRRLGG